MRKLFLLLAVFGVVFLAGCLAQEEKKSNQVTVIGELKIGQNQVQAGATTFAEMSFTNYGSKVARDVFAELSDPCALKIEDVQCSHPDARRYINEIPHRGGCYFRELKRLDGSDINWQLAAPDLGPSAILPSCRDILFKVNFTYSAEFEVDIQAARLQEIIAGEQPQAQLTTQSDFAPVKPSVRVGARQPVPVGVPFALLITLENVADGRVRDDRIPYQAFRVTFDPRMQVIGNKCADFETRPPFRENVYTNARQLELKDGKSTVALTCWLKITSIDVPRDTYSIKMELHGLGYEYTKTLPMTILPRPQ